MSSLYLNCIILCLTPKDNTDYLSQINFINEHLTAANTLKGVVELGQTSFLFDIPWELISGGTADRSSINHGGQYRHIQIFPADVLVTQPPFLWQRPDGELITLWWLRIAFWSKWVTM